MSNFKLFHFTKKGKENYSDKWLLKISPLAIAKYVQKKHKYTISWRAALAIANAEIATCYKDLVLQEENQNLKQEVMEGECEERR